MTALTLVTGATGLVGNNVVRLLIEHGQSVRVLGRETSDRRPLEGLDVQIVQGDVRDPQAVLKACQGVDRVIHAAARVQIGHSGMELQRAVNVEGTRNVAMAAREAHARLVHVSSVDALGWGTLEQPGHEETPPRERPNCPYVVTKRAAEEVVIGQISLGLDAVIVNPAYMLGPWDWKPSSGRMLLAVARGQGKLAPPGGNDFCDVRAVAAGIIAAAERGQTGRRYVLGGESLSYYDAWSLFAQITGARPPKRIVRRQVVLVIGALGSLWGRLSGNEPDINSVAAAISTEAHHFTSARAIGELGYAPGSAREAAVTAWGWFKEHGYA